MVFRVLFGRNKQKQVESKRYFSIIDAAGSLTKRSDIVVTGNAGLVFTPVESDFFVNLDNEIFDLLRTSGHRARTSYEIINDEFGTRWVTLNNSNLKDLATTIHLVGTMITDQGFGNQLIAATFRFDFEGKQSYFIYNVKQGNFYPLVTAGDRERDNMAEMQLRIVMDEEKIPCEQNLENWYPLWGIPF